MQLLISLKTTGSLIQMEALLISGCQQPFSENLFVAIVRKLNDNDDDGQEILEKLINEYLEIVDTSVD